MEEALLSQALSVALGDFLVDIYYYLDKRSKHIKGVKALQELCDAPTHMILKHVTTRRLSLGQCLDRLIEKWESLLQRRRAKKDETKESHNIE